MEEDHFNCYTQKQWNSVVDEVEKMRARIAELEADNARLRDALTVVHGHISRRTDTASLGALSVVQHALLTPKET